MKTKEIPAELQKRANVIARKAGYLRATGMSDEITEIHRTPYGMRTYNGKFYPGVTNLKWAGVRVGKNHTMAAWYECAEVIIPTDWLKLQPQPEKC